MSDLFETISEDEFKAATETSATKTPTGRTRKRKAVSFEDRTNTGWFKLNALHSMGFCTVPMHDEIQQSLHPEKKEYRQKYPVRMIVRIGNLDVCRDCFVAEADKDV